MGLDWGRWVACNDGEGKGSMGYILTKKKMVRGTGEGEGEGGGKRARDIKGKTFFRGTKMTIYYTNQKYI